MEGGRFSKDEVSDFISVTFSANDGILVTLSFLLKSAIIFSFRVFFDIGLLYHRYI